ncbi:MAG: hypothetical protein M3P29_05170 [Acidobacteriota bacterium]|nr:hypothetical protein [Acidobacteriota bacterium]
MGCVQSMAAAFLVVSAVVAAPLPRHIPAALQAVVLSMLRDTNAANDFRRFEAALAIARSLADTMPLGAERNALRRDILVYEDVEAVWGFAVRDRNGAFFNDDSLPGMRDRLDADYRGYEEFIAGYRIVDRSGNILYPTAETRGFLLKRVAPPKQKAPVTTRRPA